MENLWSQKREYDECNEYFFCNRSKKIIYLEKESNEINEKEDLEKF